MIYLLTGENSFAIDRLLEQIITKFGGVPEKIDGAELKEDQLSDLFMGQSLFADKRLIVIKRLSENTTIWPELSGWFEKASDTTDIVLVEPSLDKRTKTSKWLLKHAIVHECAEWTSRDHGKAVEWARVEAKKKGFELSTVRSSQLVDRIGVVQWQLAAALDKLALVEGEVTQEIIDDIVEATPENRIFELFGAALEKDTRKVREIIDQLQRDEDPYRVFGLLSSQVLQFAALCLGGKSPREVATDIGAHPFALSKLAPYARTHGQAEVAVLVQRFAETDRSMKTTSVDSWLLIEKLLLQIATL